MEKLSFFVPYFWKFQTKENNTAYWTNCWSLYQERFLIPLIAPIYFPQLIYFRTFFAESFYHSIWAPPSFSTLIFTSLILNIWFNNNTTLIFWPTSEFIIFLYLLHVIFGFYAYEQKAEISHIVTFLNAFPCYIQYELVSLIFVPKSLPLLINNNSTSFCNKIKGAWCFCSQQTVTC